MRAIRGAGFARATSVSSTEPMIRCSVPGTGTNGHRIKTVLRGEGVARIRTSQAGADDSPIHGALGKKVVDHHRLVGAVERADSKVDDARFDPGAVVTGAADLAGEPIEAGVREAQIALYRVKTGDFRRLA